MRNSPPGRRSPSTWPCQRARRSGSVIAAHRSSMSVSYRSSIRTTPTRLPIAGCPGCGYSDRVTGHLALLRWRFPRATSVCKASSRCSHRARYRPSHSSTSASGPGRRGVDPPLCLADIDQPGFPQHPQVPRDARASDWQQRCQFTRGCRTVGQGFQQRSPAFVGHCPQNSLHSREGNKMVT